MSVPKRNRTQGRLECVTTADKMAQHTLALIAGGFIPGTHPAAFELGSLAVRIFALLVEMNETPATDAAALGRIESVRTEAIAKCRTMLAVLELARQTLKLNARRVHYWARLITATRNQAIAWEPRMVP